jgi:hypothetical protein
MFSGDNTNARRVLDSTSDVNMDEDEVYFQLFLRNSLYAVNMEAQAGTHDKSHE